MTRIPGRRARALGVRVSGRLLVLAATFGWSAAARAQEASAATAPSAATCDSIIRSAAVDSQRVIVRVNLSREDGGSLPEDLSTFVLQEFGARFVPPRPLGVPVFASGPVRLRAMRPEHDADRALRMPFVQGVYRFVVRRHGDGGTAAVLLESLVPGLDSAVASALTTAGSERAFPIFPEEIGEDSLALQLRLTSGPVAGGRTVDLFASWFPLIPVTDAVRGSAPALALPAEERALRSGDVMVQVVVGSDGSPYFSTIEVTQGTTLGLVRAALVALASMKWTPARVGECPVPQLVHVPFHFGAP